MNANTNIHLKIAKLCLDNFKSLSKSGKPKENEWTILSCIVREDSEDFKVVALGTGTKCIGEDLMSEFGDILNDSHAEIICRRAFLRFIYEDMLTEQKIATFDRVKQSFTLQPHIKFHFFSTHTPCGDCAIFSKQHLEEFGDLIGEGGCGVSCRKKIKFDIYRTGAKCLAASSEHDSYGEGTDYHITGVVRRKPGRGSPTLSVSCSDKIAKWCHLGVQGALLSILLDRPIYMDSFTICGGTPFDNNALKRGLYTRLGEIRIINPYQRHKMKINQVDLEFPFCKCQGKYPCPSSIIWLSSKQSKRQLEVAVNGKKQGTTKKQSGTSGRLKICKKELFHYFVQVIRQNDIALNDISDLNELTYHKAKSLAVGYQSSWTILKEAFKTWSEKDKRFLEFTSEL